MENKQIFFFLSIAFFNFLCQSLEVDPIDISDVKMAIEDKRVDNPRQHFLNLKKQYDKASADEKKEIIKEACGLARITMYRKDKGYDKLHTEIEKWIQRKVNPLPSLPVSPKAEEALEEE